MQTLDCVSGLHNCLKFSQPFTCLDKATCKHRTSALLLIQFKNTGNLLLEVLYFMILTSSVAVPDSLMASSTSSFVSPVTRHI